MGDKRQLANVQTTSYAPKGCEFVLPNSRRGWFGVRMDIRVNDPSAGSPTETLLRLLLPLSDKVY